MSGKFFVILLVLAGAVAGVSLYYLQVYGYYRDVVASPGADVVLLDAASGEPVAIAYADFQAIDSDSSPIRYRACFTTSLALDVLTAKYMPADKAVPRNAPFWFDCFDAAAIGADLSSGRAVAFISRKNVHYGVDRIAAITADGRGYVWHDLNDCGEKAYDGTVVGEECPPRPAATSETN